jgi:hypothetical protein
MASIAIRQTARTKLNRRPPGSTPVDPLLGFAERRSPRAGLQVSQLYAHFAACTSRHGLRGSRQAVAEGTRKGKNFKLLRRWYKFG